MGEYTDMVRPPGLFSALQSFALAQDEDVMCDLQAQISTLILGLAPYLPDLPAVLVELLAFNDRERVAEADPETRADWLANWVDRMTELTAWRRDVAMDYGVETRGWRGVLVESADTARREAVRELESALPRRRDADLVELTPELAKEILGRGRSPRRTARTGGEYDHRRAALYAHLMRKGRWGISRDAIELDEEGRTIDGIVRLFAVADSGVAIQVFIDRAGS